MAGEIDRRLLLLDPGDNVLAACRDLPAGEEVTIDGAAVRLADAAPVGHKVARRAIGEGEAVVKHGARIGSATRDIAAGERVHVHNMRSDYIPTFARGGDAATEGEEAP